MIKHIFIRKKTRQVQGQYKGKKDRVDCDLMQNWASSYGTVERQRTVRQKNYGKTWHATRVYLPEIVCGIRPASNFKHACQRTNWRSRRKQQAPLERKQKDDEIADEFDSSSDEEVKAEDAERGNSFL